MKQIIRGDVIYVDLGQHPKTSIQSGVRPCVVVSNNKNNKFSKNINICPCTSRVPKKKIYNTYIGYTKGCERIL